MNSLNITNRLFTLGTVPTRICDQNNKRVSVTIMVASAGAGYRCYYRKGAVPVADEASDFYIMGDTFATVVHRSEPLTIIDEAHPWAGEVYMSPKSGDTPNIIVEEISHD